MARLQRIRQKILERAYREVIKLWLREFRVRVECPWLLVGRSRRERRSRTPTVSAARRPYRTKMADVPEISAERIFHETKFVFLSCAQVRTGSVVHTTVDADVQSGWTHTPQSVKLKTTHIVRCETEILQVKSS